MRGRGYVSVNVEVDVDEVLADLDDDQLRECLASREPQVQLIQIYEAMAYGTEERAWSLIRDYVQSNTGRILP